MFIYGNYIDEVLYTQGTNPGTRRYYVHDHLYSPVALVYATGTVLERYEYDAYGKCYVLEPNFAPDSDGESDYGNPYYFTGRRLDELDNGNLKVYNYRTRYYDCHTGRFLQHDQLGINPTGEKYNKFLIYGQYRDSLNLYQYVNSNPVVSSDPFGLSIRGSIGDFGFFLRFWRHRYYGGGARWTSGAERLKRQSKVKGPTASTLKLFMLNRCSELPAGGRCDKSGWIIEEVSDAYASDTIGMKASLFGPWGYYIRGRYASRKELVGGKCKCTVIFSNKYVWADMGDLNLEWWADRLLDRSERISIIGSRLAVDFPVDIRWTALSMCTKMAGESLKCSGWPFE